MHTLVTRKPRTPEKSRVRGSSVFIMPYLFDDMSVGSFFSGIGAFEKALTRLDEKKSENIQHGSSAELTQVGYINDYNGDANRVYDGAAIARALKAEAGGGGAKTGWYSVNAPLK